jgi:hypothetical protein
VAEPPSERILSQLRLALLSDCGCKGTLAKAEDDARGAGLTGAEIDAALAERSFDVRTSAILAFGCALKQGELTACTEAEKHALSCGLDPDELEFVRGFVHQLIGIEKQSSRLRND